MKKQFWATRTGFGFKMQPEHTESLNFYVASRQAYAER